LVQIGHGLASILPMSALIDQLKTNDFKNPLAPLTKAAMLKLCACFISDLIFLIL
jgi:hypothetical protein